MALARALRSLIEVVGIKRRLFVIGGMMVMGSAVPVYVRGFAKRRVKDPFICYTFFQLTVDVPYSEALLNLWF